MKIETKNWKEVDIAAPREKVWRVLTDDASYREWTTVFQEGSHAETDWQQGSRVLFVDESGDGLIGKLAKVVPNEFIGIEYVGQIMGGVEDYDSDEAKMMIGGYENYDLTEIPGGTHLAVSVLMDQVFLDMMNAPWDQAIVKIKEIAERQ